MRLQKEEVATIIILVCALIAIAILFFVMSGGTHKPFTKDSAVGDKVLVEGTLLSKERTYTGGHLIAIVKTDSGLAKLFVPSTSESYDAVQNAIPGDDLRITGEVEVYRGEKEVVAD